MHAHVSSAELEQITSVLRRAEEMHMAADHLIPPAAAAAELSPSSLLASALPPHVSTRQRGLRATPHYHPHGLTVRTIAVARSALPFERALDHGRVCLRQAGAAALQIADPAADAFDAPAAAAASRRVWRMCTFDAVVWGVHAGAILNARVREACDVTGLAEAAMGGCDVSVIALGPASGGQGDLLLGASESSTCMAIGGALLDFISAADGADLSLSGAAVAIDDCGIFCGSCGSDDCPHRADGALLPSFRGIDNACRFELREREDLSHVVAKACAAQHPPTPSTAASAPSAPYRHAAVELVLRLDGAAHARILLVALAGRDGERDAALRAMVTLDHSPNTTRRVLPQHQRRREPRLRPAALHECVRLSEGDGSSSETGSRRPSAMGSTCMGTYELIGGASRGGCGVYRRERSGAGEREAYLFSSAAQKWVCADGEGMRSGVGWITSVERGALSPVGLAYTVSVGHPTLAPIDTTIRVELVDRASRLGEQNVHAPPPPAWESHETVEPASSSLSHDIEVHEMRERLVQERTLAKEAIAELVALRVNDAEDAAAWRALHRDALHRAHAYGRVRASKLRRTLGMRAVAAPFLSQSSRRRDVRPPIRRSRTRGTPVARRRAVLQRVLNRSPPPQMARTSPPMRARARGGAAAAVPDWSPAPSPSRRTSPLRRTNKVTSAVPLCSAVGQSLASLSDVLAARARGDAFVPYRNHPLTQLLRASFEREREERKPGARRQHTVVLGAVGPSSLSFEEIDHVLRLVGQASVDAPVPAARPTLSSSVRARTRTRARAQNQPSVQPPMRTPMRLRSQRSRTANVHSATRTALPVTKSMRVPLPSRTVVRTQANPQQQHWRRVQRVRLPGEENGWRYAVPVATATHTSTAGGTFDYLKRTVIDAPPGPAMRGRGVRKHVRMEWDPAAQYEPEHEYRDVRDIYLGGAAEEERIRASAGDYATDLRSAASRRQTVVKVVTPNRRASPISKGAKEESKNVEPVQEPVEEEGAAEDSTPENTEAEALREKTHEQATIIATLVDALHSAHGDADKHSVAARVAAHVQKPLLRETSLEELHVKFAEQNEMIGKLIHAHHPDPGAVAYVAYGGGGNDAASAGAEAARRGNGTPRRPQSQEDDYPHTPSSPSFVFEAAESDDEEETAAAEAAARVRSGSPETAQRRDAQILALKDAQEAAEAEAEFLRSELAQSKSDAAARIAEAEALAADEAACLRSELKQELESRESSAAERSKLARREGAAQAAESERLRSELAQSLASSRRESEEAAEVEAERLRAELIRMQQSMVAMESAAAAAEAAAEAEVEMGKVDGDAMSRVVAEAVAAAKAELHAEHLAKVDGLKSEHGAELEHITSVLHRAEEQQASDAVAAVTAELRSEHEEAMRQMEEQHLVDIAHAAAATDAAARATINVSSGGGDSDGAASASTHAARTPTRASARSMLSTPLPSVRRLELLALQREEATFLRGQSAVYDVMATELDADRVAQHGELQLALEEQRVLEDDLRSSDDAREEAGIRTVMLTASTLQLTTLVAQVRVHADACRVRATTLPTTQRYTPRPFGHSSSSSSSEEDTLHWGITQCLDFHTSHSKRLHSVTGDSCQEVRAMHVQQPICCRMSRFGGEQA